MIPNKNFYFSEFVELLTNFCRSLTNYSFRKCCTRASFQPITLAARSFDSYWTTLMFGQTKANVFGWMHDGCSPQLYAHSHWVHMWQRYANNVHVCSSFVVRSFTSYLVNISEQRTNKTERVRLRLLPSPHLANAHVCSWHIRLVYMRLNYRRNTDTSLHTWNERTIKAVDS